MARERYQAALAQLSQGPVDMDGAEPQGIGERVLVERTVEAGRCRQADQLNRSYSSRIRCAIP